MMNILEKLDKLTRDIRLIDFNDPNEFKIVKIFKISNKEGKTKYLKKVTNQKYETWRLGDKKKITRKDRMVNVNLNIFGETLIIRYYKTGNANGTRSETFYPIDKINRSDIRGTF